MTRHQTQPALKSECETAIQPSLPHPERLLAPRLNAYTMLVALVLSFLIIGLLNLDALPPNTDEAGYTIRALMPGGGAAFVGESKLFTMQLYSLLLPGSTDPVWRARFLSVVTTAISVLLLGLFRTPREGGWYDSFVPAVLFALTPLVLFYSRIAMPEAFLVTTGCAVLVAGSRLAVRPSTARAVLLGACLALALTVQMIALLFFAFPVLAILCFGSAPWKRYIRILAVSYSIPFVSLVVLWGIGWGSEVLSHGFIATTRGDILGGAAAQVLQLAFINSGRIYRWLHSSMMPPLFWLGIAGAALVIAARQRSGVFWVLVAAVYVVPFQLGAGILLPQYMLFMTVPLVFLAYEAITAAAPLLSRVLYQLTFVPVPPRAASILLAAAVAVPLVARDYAVIFRPETARVSDDLHVAFVNAWPSGYCGRSVAQYLTRIAEASPRGIRVLIFGVGDGAKRVLTLEIFRSPAIRLHELDLAEAEVRKQAGIWAAREPVYVVMDDPPFTPSRNVEYGPIIEPLIPVFLTEKPEGASATVVYRWRQVNLHTAAGDDLALRLEQARIMPEIAGPAHRSVELVDAQYADTNISVLATLAPVEIAFPFHTGKPANLSFSLRLPPNSVVPIEAAVDLACGSARKNVFRKVIAPPEGAEWRSWTVPLDPGSMNSCSFIARALPASGGGLSGGRSARLLWSGLVTKNE